MKNILFILTATAFFACSSSDQNVKQSFGRYGDTTFSTVGAIAAENLLTMLEEQDTVMATVKGNIAAVCQAKGCWMSMKLNDEQNMRVTFKDYGFFVPKNSKNKMAIIHGAAQISTSSVAMLQEYAKDEGQTEEEIQSITEPRIEYSFVADGVAFEE